MGYKTITIRRQNKITKQYNFKGSVRNPEAVLVVKIGKTWGPINSRMGAINFITVVENSFARYWKSKYQSFKLRTFKFLEVLGIIIISLSCEYCLEDIMPETYWDVDVLHQDMVEDYLDIKDLHSDTDDSSIKINDLYLDRIQYYLGTGEFYPEKYYLNLDRIKSYLDIENGYINNLGRIKYYLGTGEFYPENCHLDLERVKSYLTNNIEGYLGGDVANKDMEMDKEIPFIAELDEIPMDAVDLPKGKLSAWEKWWTEPSYTFNWEEEGLTTECELQFKEQAVRNTSDFMEASVNINEMAYLKNSQLSYNIFNLDGHRFIITNQALFDTEWFRSISDLAVDKTVEKGSGNTVTNLTIDPEVANLLFSMDSPVSSLNESSGGSLAYEIGIREIRDAEVVTSSPEFREMLESIRGSRGLTILDVSPTNQQETSNLTTPSEITTASTERTRELEWRDLMRANWKERINILFSNQNPEAQAMPSWFEVPSRPTEPWAIEQWEKDNVMRRFWSERLNGGYNQTNIIIGDKVDRDNLSPCDIPLPYNNDYDLLFDYDISPCDIPLPEDSDDEYLSDGLSTSEYLSHSGFSAESTDIPELIQIMVEEIADNAYLGGGGDTSLAERYSQLNTQQQRDSIAVANENTFTHNPILNHPSFAENPFLNDPIFTEGPIPDYESFIENTLTDYPSVTSTPHEGTSYGFDIFEEENLGLERLFNQD